MAYILLPSSRLAKITADLARVIILPIKADEFQLLSLNNNSILATSYVKTVTLFKT